MSLQSAILQENTLSVVRLFGDESQDVDCVRCVLRMSGLDPWLPNIEPLLTRGFWVVLESSDMRSSGHSAERDGNLTADVNLVNKRNISFFFVAMLSVSDNS